MLRRLFQPPSNGRTCPAWIVALALLLAASPGLLWAAPPPTQPTAVPSPGAPRPDAPPPAANRVREIYVPFGDLQVLLEGQPRRVLLSREEYDNLLKEAEVQPESGPPHEALLIGADYQADIRNGRADLAGELLVDVLEDGLHALPLSLSGVGLTAATLDGQAAAIGRAPSGQLNLLVEGTGRHKLELRMVAPVETTAARQILHFRLPHPPATRFRLTVPGDVELKSGAELVRRTVDDDAEVTRLEMLPSPGDTTLELTLNSRQRRQQQAVVARSVLVDEITQAYERLHASLSLGILHGAVDRFRFAVPEGFEITEVDSPELARWVVEPGADGSEVLVVELREPSSETVLLHLAAVRTPAPLDDWRLPVPRLLADGIDVAGEVAVVGLLVEERLRAETITAENLVRIDTGVLRQALPETVFHAEPGAPSLRPVVAYYAPQGEFSLGAVFRKPPAELAVSGTLLWMLGDEGHEALGGFALLPKVDKCFAFEFTVPAGWHIRQVTDREGNSLVFQRHGPVEQSGRVHVRLSRPIEAGEEYHVHYEAVHVPEGWLGDWTKRTVPLPVFRVSGATHEDAAVAVAVRGDMTVHPESQQGLVPLDESEQAARELDEVATVLALRSLGPEYGATLAVERTAPRLTARTCSLLRIRPDGLSAQYQVDFTVEEARVRQLRLSLPAATTPDKLTIRGLEGVGVKQYHAELADGLRRWTVELEEPLQGLVRLAVEMHRPLGEKERQGLALPIVAADGVAYQSGLVAVEGSAELDTELSTELTPVDVGELADAHFQPGRRLLGVYSFVGNPAQEQPKQPIQVRAEVARRPSYPLYAAIVERAKLTTLLSVDGASQTKALLSLRTKALYLELRLPPGSQLWSAHLDGVPVKPQREDDRLLVSLPARGGTAARELKVVYATPVRPVAQHGTVSLPAPQLLLHEAINQPGTEVPLGDLEWKVRVPPGYNVVHSGGTLTTEDVRRPTPALWNVGAAFYELAGGIHPFYMTLGAARGFARDSSRPAQNNFRLHGMTKDAIISHERAGADEPPAEMPAADSGVLYEDAAMPSSGEAEKIVEEMVEEEAPVTKPVPEDSAAEPELTAEPMPAEPDAPQTPEAQKLATPLQPTLPTENGPGALDLQGMQVDTSDVAVQLGEGKPAKRTRGPARARRFEGLEGVRSLPIDPEQSPEYGGRTVTLRSLGDDPQLELTLAHRPVHRRLAWGAGLLVFLAGLAATRHRVEIQVRLVLLAVFVGTLLALVVDNVEAARVGNALVYGASLLVPYFLLAAAVRWLWRVGARCVEAVGRFIERRRCASAAKASVAVMVCFLLHAGGAPLQAAEPPVAVKAPRPPSSSPYVIQIVEPGNPVKVPEDAIILPYDPQSPEGHREANRLMVPYARYVELWNRAHPDQKLETPPPPLPYALAGGIYSATLQGDDFLLVTGQLEIDVFGEEPVSIPLRLGGGVLSLAELDGKPAPLRVVEAAPPVANAPAQQQKQVRAQQSAAQVQQSEAVPPGGSLLLLHVDGKGRHRLKLALRLRLVRQGGWRVADGVLPAAPATALALKVPAAQTEVRLGRVADRSEHETEQAGERIETALGSGGALAVRWRPKVAEGRIDRTLTAESLAVLDVQEDGLRLVWRVRLEFRHGEREAFRLRVPGNYTVEKVEGTNRRGWETRPDGAGQAIDVSLLSGARTREELVVHLWRRGAVGQGSLAEFKVPVLEVPEAALHRGEINIRRSPLLEVWAVESQGVGRTDLSPEVEQIAGGADSEESPLGIQPLAAYRFAATPYTVRLAARPLAAEVSARLQSVLKIAEYERSLESRVVLDVRGRPLHRAEVFLPEGLQLESVSAPGSFEWGVTPVDGRRLLSVHLGSGRRGEVPILLSGRLGEPGRVEELAVPRLEVREVERQRGDLAIQVDPALKVEARDLQGCQPVALLGQVYDWLKPELRPLTHLALQTNGGDYGGTLAVVDRSPVVRVTTLSNVRITDRVVEETILLGFDVRQAGVRRLQFQLPARLADARISVPLLRRKTVEAVPGTGDQVRVTLELQDDVGGEIRVLVEYDRSAEPGRLEAAPTVPIPIVDTGRTDRRLVTLETAARHRLIDVEPSGLVPLSPELKEWQALRATLGHDIQQAFLVDPAAEQPRLVWRTRSRPTVETTGARIGLSETELVIDANGAYRGAVVLKIDNTTEQYLEIELPEGARLWTAAVDGDPVKPATLPGGTNPQVVRIPILKTQPGDLDYSAVLLYGGKQSALNRFGRVTFPLVRSRNIAVERSTVQLFVPKTHDWLRFGGTMGPPAERADLAALFGAYQEQKAESLLGQLREATRGNKAFEKVRAMSNLKRQVAVMQDYYSSSVSGYSSNEHLEAQLAGTAAVIDEVQQELEQIDGGDQPAFEADNRDRLNDLYVGQKFSRSRNVVQDLGGNWSDEAPEQPPEEAGELVFFNGRWLDKNKLQNPYAREDDEDRNRRQGNRRAQTAGGKGLKLDWGTSGREAGKPQQVAQPKAPEFAQTKLKAALNEQLAKKKPAAAEQARGSREAEAVLKYQQQLAAQSAMEQDGQQVLQSGPVSSTRTESSLGRDAADLDAAKDLPPATTVASSPPALGDTERLTLAPRGGAVRPAPLEGMASLELQLPRRDEQTYRVYRFAAPLGENRIVAYAIRARLLLGLAWLAALLLLSVVLWLAARAARRGRFAWLAQPKGTWLMIAVGVFCLLVGLFPIAALALLVAGITLKIRHWLRRRAPAEAVVLEGH